MVSMDRSAREHTIMRIIQYLQNTSIPVFDWVIHNVVFLLEFYYGVDTGYSGCNWVYQPYGVWCEDLYSDTRRLIDEKKIYRLENGELRVFSRSNYLDNKYHSNIRIPYQLAKMRIRDIVYSVFKVYNEILGTKELLY
ncbi:hypothetical protein J4526_07600 [Desulfurococcaceae archaeon MEX13E-LK6-19]|nr:hypothetical protein J4526_07600 [Desulfurococcaceae archaeon MEX13E-LK6-19]